MGAVFGRDNETRALIVRDAPSSTTGGRAGLLPGDQVLMIDGHYVNDLDAKDVRARLRGDVGSTVRLTVVRNGDEVLTSGSPAGSWGSAGPPRLARSGSLSDWRPVQWYRCAPMRKMHAALQVDPSLDDRVPAHPFLKWAGGKWAIAPRIESLLPADTRERVYREPFVGGGAMYFHLQPQRAFLSDSLKDLVATYQVVQHHVDALVTRLEKLRATHTTEQFYAIRAAFNEQRSAPRVERAAWLIYLNKTCYNGLFRTNQSGAFNVPVGRFSSTPHVVDPPALRLAAAALAGATVTCAHFEHLLAQAEPGDVIYFDPPYVPLSKTSSFSSYADGNFTLDDQAHLAEVFRELDERGCLLALSNSDTPEVRRLYEGFDVSPIIAPRAISSKASTRGEVTELLIRNVARYPGSRAPRPVRAH